MNTERHEWEDFIHENAWWFNPLVYPITIICVSVCFTYSLYCRVLGFFSSKR
jgi:hypothetical protein